MRSLAVALFSFLVCALTGAAWAAPRVLVVDAGAPSPALDALSADLRARADGFVFLCGGASRLAPEFEKMLLSMFDAFRILSARGRRFAVGDGGTKSGIMEAAGLARAASHDAFPLVGVSPQPDVALDAAPGSTSADPNHSDLVLVRDAAWQAPSGWQPSWGHWGMETASMYAFFDRLAEGRRSVAVVANGGGITLDEVERNLRAGRRMIVIWGSGRAADAISSTFTGIDPVNLDDAGRAEYAKLKARVAALHVADHPDQFLLVPITDGGFSLAHAIERELDAPRP